MEIYFGFWALGTIFAVAAYALQSILNRRPNSL